MSSYNREESNNDSHDWNMAIAFLQRLDRRLDEAQQARASGNLLSWFRLLKAIFNQIHFRIEERKDKLNPESEQNKVSINLNDKFNSIKNKFSNSQILAAEQQKGMYTTIEGELDELERTLNDLLYAYGLVFGNSYKKSLEEELADDFEGDE